MEMLLGVFTLFFIAFVLVLLYLVGRMVLQIAKLYKMYGSKSGDSPKRKSSDQ